MIHTKPNNGATNDWLTPPEIVKCLGSFDLDPCASTGQPWNTAKKMIALPDDGLAVDWVGRVWLNPPYGQQLKQWIKRLSEHGNGIALVPSRTEVESWFWPFIWERACGILFVRGRFHFLQPDGTRRGNCGHGSVLVAYGENNCWNLRNSGIRGAYVPLKHHAIFQGR